MDKKTSLGWREANAWLAGYSDALAGNEASRAHWSPDYVEHYERGLANGARRAELRAA